MKNKKVFVGAHCEIEFNYISNWARRTPEDLEKELNSRIKEFNDFLRDHRSQDVLDISVIRDYEWQCPFCNRVTTGAEPEECCDKMCDEIDSEKVEATNG